MMVEEDVKCVNVCTQTIYVKNKYGHNLDGHNLDECLAAITGLKQLKDNFYKVIFNSTC